MAFSLFMYFRQEEQSGCSEKSSSEVFPGAGQLSAFTAQTARQKETDLFGVVFFNATAKLI